MIVLIVSLPIFRRETESADFVGTDDRAVEAIGVINPNFRPLMAPVFEPGESLERSLFLAQALGGGSLFAYSLYRLIRRGGRQIAGKRLPRE